MQEIIYQGPAMHELYGSELVEAILLNGIRSRLNQGNALRKINKRVLFSESGKPRLGYQKAQGVIEGASAVVRRNKLSARPPQGTIRRQRSHKATKLLRVFPALYALALCPINISLGDPLAYLGIGPEEEVLISIGIPKRRSHRQFAIGGVELFARRQ